MFKSPSDTEFSHKRPFTGMLDRHPRSGYAEQTGSLIAFYADERILIGVDATGPVEEITSRALAALRPFVR